MVNVTLEHVELQKSAHAAKQLVDAQLNETRDDRARELDALRNLFKVRESKLLEECDEWMAE